MNTIGSNAQGKSRASTSSGLESVEVAMARGKDSIKYNLTAGSTSDCEFDDT